MKTVIDVPYPPRYGKDDPVTLAVDKRFTTTIGDSNNPWLLDGESGTWYCDIEHELASENFVHEFYVETQKATSYPQVQRLNLNTVRIWWNYQERLKMNLFRIRESFL